MKNKELFNKTVGILVKAYQNDTLKHTSCKSCAVGNLISNNGIEPDPSWLRFIYGDALSEETLSIAFKMVKSTGYTSSQLYQIEKAFEMDSCLFQEETFTGLMRVIDTLMLIHECTQEETESAKLQFVK